MNNQINRIVPTWRRKQAAMLNNRTKLQRENQKLRDALRGIHSMANDGLRTEDGGNSYWQIEADAAAALGLSDKERGIEPHETHYLHTTIDDQEVALLNVLANGEQPMLDLERAGYHYESIARLELCSFAWTYEKRSIPYVKIMPRGLEFLKGKANDDTN